MSSCRLGTIFGAGTEEARRAAEGSWCAQRAVLSRSSVRLAVYKRQGAGHFPLYFKEDQLRLGDHTVFSSLPYTRVTGIQFRFCRLSVL